MVGIMYLTGILSSIAIGLAFILLIDYWDRFTIFGKMLCILSGIIGFPVVFFWLMGSPMEYLCNYIGRTGRKLIIK